MATTYPIPKKLYLSDKSLEASIELILFNFKVRKVVANIRERWQGEIEEVTKPNTRSHHEVFNSIKQLAASFNPPLSEAWQNLIFDYAVYGEVYPLPVVDMETESAQEFLAAYSQLLRKVNPEIVPFEIGRKADKITITIREKLSTSDVRKLNMLIRALQEELPAKPRSQSSNIRLMSRLMDYRREGLDFESIAAKLPGFYDSTSLRKMASRAKRLGL